MRHSLEDLSTVILAGGLGTRLSPLFPDTPKALVPVEGRPFLAHLFDWLERAGVRRVVLATGHLGHRIEAAFGSSYGGLALAYSREPMPLGTGGALRLAVDLAPSDPVLVANGDTLAPIDLADFLAFHEREDAPASLAVSVDVRPDRYGGVSARDGRVVRFEPRPPAAADRPIGASAVAIGASAGICLVSRQLVLEIEPGAVCSLEEDLLPAWVGRGVAAYQTRGPFLDIGTPEGYRAAPGFLRGLAAMAPET